VATRSDDDRHTRRASAALCQSHSCSSPKPRVNKRASGKSTSRQQRQQQAACELCVTDDAAAKQGAPALSRTVSLTEPEWPPQCTQPVHNDSPHDYIASGSTPPHADGGQPALRQSCSHLDGHLPSFTPPQKTRRSMRQSGNRHRRNVPPVASRPPESAYQMRAPRWVHPGSVSPAGRSSEAPQRPDAAPDHVQTAARQRKALSHQPVETALNAASAIVHPAAARKLRCDEQASGHLEAHGPPLTPSCNTQVDSPGVSTPR
jgi:hypothetical protein